MSSVQPVCHAVCPPPRLTHTTTTLSRPAPEKTELHQIPTLMLQGQRLEAADLHQPRLKQLRCPSPPMATALGRSLVTSSQQKPRQPDDRSSFVMLELGVDLLVVPSLFVEPVTQLYAVTFNQQGVF